MTFESILEQRLLTFVREEFAGDPEDVVADTDLLTSGIVDSLGVMRLVRLIESEADLRIPPTDITLEHFLNIRRMCEYVSARRGAGAGDASGGTAR